MMLWSKGILTPDANGLGGFKQKNARHNTGQIIY